MNKKEPAVPFGRRERIIRPSRPPYKTRTPTDETHLADVRPLEESLDPRVLRLKPSATLAVAERSNELKRQGKQVYKLGLGQSPFPIPRPAVDALREAAAHGEYLPVIGLPELRQAVAEHHKRVDQVEIDPELVLIGPGTKELLFLSQLCFEGDILVPTPCWVSYAPQAGIVGRRIVLIPTGYDHGWKLRPDQIVDICRNDPGRPRMLILNYPGNPTGTSYDAREVAQLAEAARTYNLIVLSDEIYGQLTYDQKHISFAREYPEGTIVSSGLSKWCGAAGWRLGTFAFPPALAWLQQAMRKVASSTYTCAAAPVQYAAIEAFAGGAEIDAYLQQARRILQALGRRCCGELRKAGCLLRDPRGGFYLFPDFTPLRDRLAERGVHTDGELACAAIDELGVAFLPGAAFGMEPEQLTARIAYVDFDGGPALDEAFGSPSKEIDDAFLRRHCGPVLEGIDRLCSWLAR